MISAADKANIGVFAARYTMTHTRIYPHPIERVWRAVTDARELSAWYVPEWTVDPRLGGAWSCTYGHPTLEEAIAEGGGVGHGVIVAWEPPRLVDYGGQHRFELTEVEGGTRLDWTQTFDPAVRAGAVEAKAHKDWQDRHGENWENPGGPGYPMLPGGQAGNHWGADDLSAHLDGRTPRPFSDRAYYHALTDLYDAHFRAELPRLGQSPWPLATFEGPRAMRYVRVYDHPIERVFEAVSTAQHLDAWMLPICHVERRLGGAWSMTFANPDPAKVVTGVIVAWEPPRLVDYGGMRFELQTRADGKTRLDFVHSFAPGDYGPTDEAGGDQPAGPGTPWRPGFLVGFHLMLDGLARFLEGRPDPIPFIDGVHAFHHGVRDAEDLLLEERYRTHVRDHCPRA